MLNTHWSQYWSHGHTTSFREQFDTGYEKQIKDFWRNSLRPFDMTRSILDIGTGNGGLIQLLNRICAVKHQYTGIDSALINPVITSPSIHFKSQTQAENLNMGKNSVDLAVSQFGFEYSDFNLSVGQIKSALRPGGQLIVMMHHHLSEITLDTEHTLAAIEICHHRLKLLEKTSALLSAMEHTRNDELTLSRLRRTLNRTTSHIELSRRQDCVAYNRFADFYIAACLAVFEQKSIMHPQQQIKMLRDEITAYEARMKDMHQASLNPEKVVQLKKLLQQSGFLEVVVEEFDLNQHIFAYTLKATNG